MTDEEKKKVFKISKNLLKKRKIMKNRKKKKFEEALKKPEFRELFIDYMKEMQDPANRAEYEREIAKYEAQVVCDAVLRQNKLAVPKNRRFRFTQKQLNYYLRPPKTLGRIHLPNRRQQRKKRRKSSNSHRRRANRSSKEIDEIFKIRALQIPAIKAFSEIF